MTDQVSTSLVHHLLQAGANPAITNDREETPLALLRRKNLSHRTSIALFDQVPEAEKASLLVKARHLVTISRNTEAPSYLQGRMLRGLPLPHVTMAPLTDGQDEEEARKFCSMLSFLLGVDSGPEGEGMPRDVFRVVLDLLMPSWDPLRRRPGGEQPMLD